MLPGGLTGNPGFTQPQYFNGFDIRHGLINLRVSKKFSRYVTLSFFAKNLADMARMQITSGQIRNIRFCS